MVKTYHLTPHNGLNQADCSINVYNCYIFLPNDGKPNTGVIYMLYAEVTPASPEVYNFVVSFDPVNGKDINIDFKVGIPSVQSTFMLMDADKNEIDRKTFKPDATNPQIVPWKLKNFKGNRVLLQVSTPSPSADIFYFYECNVEIPGNKKS